jgi:hypothetical protein
MRRAGIQMLAPKPFFSLIGKYVVHDDSFFILGRASSAWAVVRTGAVTVSAGSTVGAAAPAYRAESVASTRANVASTSNA